MENVMPPGFLLLKQPLAESFWVFSNPVKIPQWILPSLPELKEFFSLLCLPAQSLNALLAEFPLHLTERSAVLSSSPVHLCTCSMPTWQSFTESSVILFSSSNSQQSSSNCTLCLCSMPTWQSFTELLRDYVCNCVFSHTALPPEVFSNLKGLPPELLISALVPQHAFV
jgi:hypothetical protein